MSDGQINKNITEIIKDDVYSIMMLLLYASDDNPKYNAINELAYILDHDSFLNFIKFYEGQVIKVPTMKEIKTSLKTLLLFQYYKIEKYDWQTALKMAGFEEEETFSAKRRLTKFIEYVDNHNYKLGGSIR